MVQFVPNFAVKYVKNGSSCYNAGIIEALRECATRAQHFDIGDKELLLWAKQGFKLCSADEKFLPLDPDNPVPELVKLWYASQRKPVSTSTNGKCAVRKVLNGDTVIENICIACKCDVDVDCVHPLFVGGLCLRCKDKVKAAALGTSKFCVICGSNGEMVTCDRCSRQYCKPCLTYLVGPREFAHAKEQNPWHCNLCEHDDKCGFLQRRENWEGNLVNLKLHHPIAQLRTPRLENCNKRPIRVLMLFDHRTTGKHALEDLGITVDQYYVSEYGPESINLAFCRNENEAKHLGNVQHLSESKIAKLCPIDLLVGRTRCNKARMPANHGTVKSHAEDKTNETVLFFEYYRTFEMVFKHNRDHPLFWLFETSAAISNPLQDIICRYFGSEPAKLNAIPMEQSLLVWGNVPDLHRSFPKTILYGNMYDANSHNSTPSISGRTLCSEQQKKVVRSFEKNGNKVGHWTVNLERFSDFTLELNGAPGNQNISDPVLRHIFNPLKMYFSGKR